MSPLGPGDRLPDIELDDHAGNRRRLSELVGGDPTSLQFFRGWWCPKEQRFFRRLIALQDEAEVAYARLVPVSVDPPRSRRRSAPGSARAGRSCPTRTAPCRPSSACARRPTRVNDPYVPAVFTLFPDLTIHRAYDGYWYWGRPTTEELRQRHAAIPARDPRRLGGARGVTAAGWRCSTRRPADATAQAVRTSRGSRRAGSRHGAGARSRPALRAASTTRIVDPDGEPGWVSLVLPPDGVRLAFDDLAVQQARRRRARRAAPGRAVPTLMRDALALRRCHHGRARHGRGTARRRPVRATLPREDPAYRRRHPRRAAAACRPRDRALRQREPVAVGSLRVTPGRLPRPTRRSPSSPTP